MTDEEIRLRIRQVVRMRARHQARSLADTLPALYEVLGWTWTGSDEPPGRDEILRLFEGLIGDVEVRRGDVLERIESGGLFVQWLYDRELHVLSVDAGFELKSHSAIDLGSEERSVFESEEGT